MARPTRQCPLCSETIPLSSASCPQCKEPLRSSAAQLASTQVAEEDAGIFAPERKGIDKGMLGGVAMMGIAGVWFVGGLAAGYIFYYPPILFVIGLYAFLKGLFTGNVAGR